MRRLPLLLLVLACSSQPAREPASIDPGESWLDFGNWQRGESYRIPLHLHVRGGNPVNVDAATVPAGFSVRLGAGDVLDITFAPKELGPASGTIVVRSGQASARIHVSGIGYGWAMNPLPATLDFAAVRPGLAETLELEVQSAMFVPSHAVLWADDPTFSVEPDVLDLDPEGTRVVLVSFRADGPGPVSSVLHLAPCRGCEGMTIPLQALGGTEAFTLDPPALDFGARPLGSRTCQRVKVLNTGNIRLVMAPASLHPGDDGFEIDPTLPGALDPGASYHARVCFAPKAHGSYASSVAFRSELGSVELPVSGKGGGPRLFIDPKGLDLGNIAPGKSASGEVVVRNAGDPDPLVIQSVRFEPDDPALHLDLPDGDATGHDLSASPLRLGVTLQGVPGSHAATLVVETADGERLGVPVSGYLMAPVGCAFEVPAIIALGSLHDGDVREISIPNDSYASDCAASDISLQGAGFTLVDPPAQPLQLANLQPLRLKVLYQPPPDRHGVQSATLTFHAATADGWADEQVTLSAAWLAPGMDFNPAELHFDPVLLGSRAEFTVHVENRGEAVDVVAAGVDGAFAFENAPSTVPAGGVDFTVVFAPTEGGKQQGQLEVDLDDGSTLIVPVSGTGVSAWCDYGVFDEPCAHCPAEQRTWASAPVNLFGWAEYGDSSTCEWELVSGPDGATPGLEYADSCGARFASDVLGRYVFRLVTIDEKGIADTCQTAVDVKSFEGLRIETTWSTPDDVDLHLFHPLAGDVLSPYTWLGSPYDCDYDNADPYWDTLGRADDPMLVADDRAGTGPEIIKIDTPSTAHSYAIGVHWFADIRGAPSETVTTRVFCGGVQVAEVTTVLPEVSMAAEVGTVSWNPDSTCSFRKLNQLVRVEP